MIKSCPGSRTIKEASPTYLTCPHCGAELEIWTDEFRMRCKVCQAWVYREQGATCLDWCAKAEECVGSSILASYRQARKNPS